MPSRKITQALSAGTLAAGLVITALATAPAAEASETSFPIAWTHIGIFPRNSPSMDGNNRQGPALSDGTVVSVICEATGTTETSDAGTSDIWEQTTVGWIPNVFVDTGTDGFSDVPRCDQPALTAQPNEAPEPIDAIAYIPNDNVYKALLDHYYSSAGGTVQVDFAFYSADQRLMDFAKTLPTDSIGRQYTSDASDGEVYWASGAFSVARTSDHCWMIKDDYDFAPDKPTNWPFIGNWGNQFFGNAKEFTVRSAGCVF
ncbi:hypothetical protein C5D09_14065 [Rathayibacter sp. AY1C9]|uniref:hypothetical protein n=1 Tax=Rathayibacter sp. AY1C9 TaxID=2080541 RepID=UPI000CE73803|nr:hypothetical protein [Rathayibacter sp. AY1C9]PPH44147.1 hypothetical protein C5D09_14065 [Rathayibacter sp. AY1C9]